MQNDTTSNLVEVVSSPDGYRVGQHPLITFLFMEQLQLYSLVVQLKLQLLIALVVLLTVQPELLQSQELITALF